MNFEEKLKIIEKYSIKKIAGNYLNVPMLLDSNIFDKILDKFLSSSDSPFMQQEEEYIFEGLKPLYFKDNAILNIYGFLDQKDSIFLRFFGGISTEAIKMALINLIEDRKVEKIILDIDSPGGAVSGVQSLAEFIYKSRDEKEIIAFSNSYAMSGAAWIATSASKVYMNDENSNIGSIGVVAEHLDISKMLDDYGIKATEITAGKYKRITSRYEPLSDEGRESLQARVNEIYRIFVDSIVKYRNLDIKDISKFADGKSFMANEAIKVGLADGIQDIYEFLGVSKMFLKNKKDEIKEKENVEEEKKEVKTISIDEVVKVIDKDYMKENLTSVYSEILKKGAEQERQRIKDIDSVSKVGYEEIITKCKEDGKSTGKDVAYLIAKEEKERGIKAEDFIKDSPKPTTFLPSKSEELTEEKEEDEFVNKVLSY